MIEQMIHFCFLKADKDAEGLRPVISKDMRDLGITEEQAIEVCEEIYQKCNTIAAWITRCPA